jgi:o-succinylbenzoate synthase
MMGARAALRAFELPLVAPLATAHGQIATRQGFLVRIEDAAGRVGYGEASPLPEFGTERRDACERALVASLKAWVESGGVGDAVAVEHVLTKHTEGRPTARAALECALTDLAAQRDDCSLAVHWRRQAGIGGAPAERIDVQALVGGERPRDVFDAARTALGRGHRAYKLKLAASSDSRALGADLERVAALRDAIGASARIRLDANEAWSFETAQRALTRLAGFDIDYVEQPVARDELDALARLDRESPVRVAADEALLGAGLERCLERCAARILIVKPAAIGGFEAARRLVERARSAGLRIVWSSLLDGSVSRLAALQLAAALGSDTEVHGLGTGPWLAADLPGGPEIEAGSLARPQGAGLGLGTVWRDGHVFDAAGPPWLGAARAFGRAR